MSEIKPEDLNSQVVPFFARFLEGQSFEDLSDQESEAISGGRCGVIKPDDDQIVVTLKFPSDQEDGPISMTEKYPSDSDEYATTQKYPSDGDDHS